MILGNVCTRRCGFCAVEKGGPLPVDYDEPRRVAEAVATMGLRFAVITSVNRDDRPDGGAELFALTIRAIRERVPGCGVEVLTPDFQGSPPAVETVVEAAPEVFNHNTETVPRLYRQVRLGARYERSLEVLAHARTRRPAIPTKSGLMLGLGETTEEVLAGDARFARAPGGYSHARPIPAALAQTPARLCATSLPRNSTNFAARATPWASCTWNPGRWSVVRTMRQRPPPRTRVAGAPHAVIKRNKG